MSASSLRKARPEDVNYALVDRPEDREIDGQWKLNDIGRSFSEFELEDVRAGDLESVEGEPGLGAEMRTYDGLVVTLSTRVDGERTLAASARFDGRPARRQPPASPRRRAPSSSSLRKRSRPRRHGSRRPGAAVLRGPPTGRTTCPSVARRCLPPPSPQSPSRRAARTAPS